MKLEQQSATAGHWNEQQYRQAFQTGGATRLVLAAEDFCYPQIKRRLPVKLRCSDSW